MRKSAVQPLSSATTGALAAVTQRASVGPAPGTTGSSRSLTVSDETARDWLLRQPRPEEADAALLRSLTSTCGVTAKPRTESRFPAEGGSYQLVTGYGLDIASHDQIPVALAKVEQAMTAATTEQCETWLVMLQAACAHRADSEVSSAAAYTVYSGELRRWPADVAKAACERLARGKRGHTGPNWFPTLAELVAECERLAAPRKALLASLQRWSPEPEKPQRPTSETERQAIRRMADDAMAALQRTADARLRKVSELPSIAGKPDESGVTPEMRKLMEERGW